MIGPGRVYVDDSLMKHFNLKEGHKLQSRFEIFNLPNHASFKNPDAHINGTTPARIVQAMEPRRMRQSGSAETA